MNQVCTTKNDWNMLTSIKFITQGKKYWVTPPKTTVICPSVSFAFFRIFRNFDAFENFTFVVKKVLSFMTKKGTNYFIPSICVCYIEFFYSFFLLLAVILENVIKFAIYNCIIVLSNYSSFPLDWGSRKKVCAFFLIVVN